VCHDSGARIGGMKKLVILLGAFTLIGCGEKKETGDNGGADKEAGASESTSGERTEAPASPESQLIGYWVPNAERTIKALQAVQADHPEEIDEIENLIESLREDPAFGKDGAHFLKFEEDGVLGVYSDGEEETETYSLLIDDKQDVPIRIKAKMNGSDASMILTGETLQVFMSEDAPIKFAFFLDRIDEEEAKRRLALAAERRAAEAVPPVESNDSPPGGDE